MRILVVEESFETRELVSHILSEDGHEVTQVQWAEDALAIFKRAPFPVVVTEIAMRSMSGIELLKKIKQISPDTEVIILTSYASIDTAVSALRCGAYDYLIKPIEGISLISSVVNRTIEKIDLVSQNRAMMEQLRQENLALKEENQKLNFSKVLDPVTGLFKASYFQEALETELDRARKNQRIFSLIFLVVHCSPETRAQLSRSPEDPTIWRLLSNCVKSNLRRSDLIAFYGETGFAVLLPETPKEGAEFVAGKIHGRLQELIWPEETPSLLASSVGKGVATYPEDGEESFSLVRLASQGLRPL